MHSTTRWVPWLVLLGACTRPHASTDPERGASTNAPLATNSAETTSEACTPEKLGLAGAKQLEAWSPPAGCTLNVQQMPRVLRSEADLQTVLTCAPASASKFDFSAHAIIATQRTLSPAGVGFDVYDDGKKVTFVNRFRAPCPNDPMPMPMSSAYACVTASPGDRTISETSCTVHTTCR